MIYQLQLQRMCICKQACVLIGELRGSKNRTPLSIRPRETEMPSIDSDRDELTLTAARKPHGLTHSQTRETWTSCSRIIISVSTPHSNTHARAHTQHSVKTLISFIFFFPLSHQLVTGRENGASHYHTQLPGSSIKKDVHFFFFTPAASIYP